MRYTHKLKKPEGKCNYFLIPDREQCDNAENKLGQLEDIEDELGIDLITFHKALKNGVYYKVIDKNSSNYGKIFFDSYVLWAWDKDLDGNYYAMMQSVIQMFYLKDYGKTWALDKKDLTKEN